MDSLEVKVFVYVVENMLMTKTARGAACAFIAPVIMMVSYVQVSLVNLT